MISNSSPLIFLSKIGKLRLLKELFGNIIIPEKVRDEVIIEGKSEVLVIKKAISEEWIKIQNPKKELSLELGKGENSAINLAMGINQQLIIDDALAVKVAKSFNIGTLRATSVILSALKKRILSKKEAINSINSLIQAGYYISPKYYSLLIERLNEYNK